MKTSKLLAYPGIDREVVVSAEDAQQSLRRARPKAARGYRGESLSVQGIGPRFEPAVIQTEAEQCRRAPRRDGRRGQNSSRLVVGEGRKVVPAVRPDNRVEGESGWERDADDHELSA